MKKIYIILICLSMLFSITTVVNGECDISNMTKKELHDLQLKIEKEIDKNHSTSYQQEEAVSEITKKYVEDHFSKKGIEVSWAWFRYEYTRDWNFFTLTTHIDYSEENEKRKPDVYSEVYLENNKYSLYYIKVGSEVLLDRRKEIPDERINKNYDKSTNSSSNAVATLPSNKTSNPNFAALNKTVTVTPSTTAVVTVSPNMEPTATPKPDNITIDNNPEFAALLNGYPSPEMTDSFAQKYMNRIIEFDGNIAYLDNHGKYKTRYDFLIYPWDYSETSSKGAHFQIRNRNIFELNLIGDNIPSHITMGTNLRFVARIEGYNEQTQIFLLYPIETYIR